MAKKNRKKLILIIAAIAFVGIFAKKIYTAFVLRGVWQSDPSLFSRYPGISVGFGGDVSVSSRPDLKGKYSDGVITWADGSTWARG